MRFLNLRVQDFRNVEFAELDLKVCHAVFESVSPSIDQKQIPSAAIGQRPALNASYTDDFSRFDHLAFAGRYVLCFYCSITHP